MSADLRILDQKQRKAELEAQEFSEWDDAIMHDVMGNERLAKPVQELLLTLLQIKNIQRSFGDPCIEKAKFFDAIVPELEALRQAGVDEGRDQ